MLSGQAAAPAVGAIHDGTNDAPRSPDMARVIQVKPAVMSGKRESLTASAPGILDGSYS
jgi:hypothetical protein